MKRIETANKMYYFYSLNKKLILRAKHNKTDHTEFVKTKPLIDNCISRSKVASLHTKYRVHNVHNI